MLEACPDDCPAPKVDFDNYDVQRCDDDRAAHSLALKEWLIGNGFTGPNTGRILRIPMADGYAKYMYADRANPHLVHLPYGDGWHHPDVKFLPPKEVIRRMDESDRLDAVFESRHQGGASSRNDHTMAPR